MRSCEDSEKGILFWFLVTIYWWYCWWFVKRHIIVCLRFECVCVWISFRSLSLISFLFFDMYRPNGMQCASMTWYFLNVTHPNTHAHTYSRLYMNHLGDLKNANVQIVDSKWRLHSSWAPKSVETISFWIVRNYCCVLLLFLSVSLLTAVILRFCFFMAARQFQSVSFFFLLLFLLSLICVLRSLKSIVSQYSINIRIIAI